ncbi:hypothetical protein YTPLAS18_37550 [Nitrospira sp.]|nr:hypothetical protein YTPLAS18_37550 [Nitrospira sp.]
MVYDHQSVAGCAIEATEGLGGCKNRHSIIQALCKLDIHAGTRADRTNHEIDLIPDRSKFADEPVGDHSLARRHPIALAPEKVNRERTIHLREYFIDQPPPTDAIGPPGEISEEPEAKRPAGLARTWKCRIRKQRRYMEGS